MLHVTCYWSLPVINYITNMHRLCFMSSMHPKAVHAHVVPVGWLLEFYVLATTKVISVLVLTGLWAVKTHDDFIVLPHWVRHQPSLSVALS